MRGDENVNDRLQIQERAIDADCLDQRILENQRHQKVDLVRWIFERIHLEPGSRVLELCSGTGNQTIRMIDLVGDDGFVVATDISEKGLNQLKEKVDSSLHARFTTVTAPMDDLSKALWGAGLEEDRFDIIFCAYGLYYSDNPIKVLEECTYRLKAKGRLVVVGPFGPNNAPLFKCLEEAGVTIGDYVKYTSQEFMEGVVLPYAYRHYGENTIHVVVNPVHWKDDRNVLQYWSNTTFYDESRLEVVKMKLKEHFEAFDQFINEKWIMLVEMSNIL